MNNLNTANFQAFENAADSLYENPIYRLSLGSRELFHSNFLAWFFENNSKAVEDIFKIKIDSPKVRREKGDIDLIIEDSEGITLIAIENKIKDTPKEDQLLKYSEFLTREGKDDKPRIKKVLLSLTPPQFELKDGWEFFSYSELVGSLDKYIHGNKDVGDKKIPMLRIYAEMIKQLSLVTKFVHDHDKESRKFWFSRSNENGVKSIDNKLEDIKFSDTMQKYRASDLQNKIENAVKDSSLSSLPRKTKESEVICFTTEHGFTNKTPFVGAWLEVGAKHNELRLGVQIQGMQYRRYIIWKKFHVKENEETKNHVRLKEFVDGTDRNQWLFGTDRDEKGIIVQNGFSDSKRGFKTSLNPKNPYCSYAPNFIYQYVNISEFDSHADLQPDNLPKAVIADLEYALSLLKEQDYRNNFKSWKPKS